MGLQGSDTVGANVDANVQGSGAPIRLEPTAGPEGGGEACVLPGGIPCKIVVSAGPAQRGSWADAQASALFYCIFK